jgi:hypothetical protein
MAESSLARDAPGELRSSLGLNPSRLMNGIASSLVWCFSVGPFVRTQHSMCRCSRPRVDTTQSSRLRRRSLCGRLFRVLIWERAESEGESRLGSCCHRSARAAPRDVLHLAWRECTHFECRIVVNAYSGDELGEFVGSVTSQHRLFAWNRFKIGLTPCSSVWSDGFLTIWSDRI